MSRNNINRRYSFSLKANHKIAFLCVESTIYKYIEDLSTPKEWFKANVDEILRSYGADHSITKEDVFLGNRNRLRLEVEYLPFLVTVIGTLSAPDYALFVSHNHPDGKVRDDRWNV